jgi:RHS repeat-associated protein
MGMTESYGYDPAGNLTSRKDFNGKTTVYTYDSMNRLLSKTPDASFAVVTGFPSGTFSAPITFTYTTTGRRASMTDPSGTTNYYYDSRDRLTTKAAPEGILTYSYDTAGNLLSTQSSNNNGINIAYSYDKLSRLSTVTDNAPLTGTRPGTGVTTYGYDPAGNLLGYLYPNAVRTSYLYNTLNRLTNLTVTEGTGASATTLASYGYTLGPAGNRTSVVELSGRTVNYSYDEIYRLMSETISSDPTTANNGSVIYTYDAVGNRLTRNSRVAAVPSATSTYNANDQLGSDAYDANGSTTASDGKTYIYDFENHIIAVDPGTSGAIIMLYDGDGSRVSRTVGTLNTTYLVDDNNPSEFSQVMEERTNGSVNRVYTYGQMLIQESQIVAGAWTSSFYGLDGHGSVRFLTDSHGTITDSVDYDAFGVLIRQTGATPNDHLYAGEQLDSTLGVYYNRARYYDVRIGRFLTMDTDEGQGLEPTSLHKYLYASADPANQIDPSGHDGLPEFMQSIEVDLVLNAISSYVLQNVPERIFRALLPPGMLDSLRRLKPDAVEFGLSFGVNVPISRSLRGKWGFNAGGGLEVLVSPATSKAALYRYWSPFGLSYGQSGLSIGVQGTVGLVLNCQDSFAYTNKFATGWLLPYKAIPSDIRDKIDRELADLASKVASSSSPIVRQAVSLGINLFGQVNQTAINVFGWPDGAFGVSFGRGIRSAGLNNSVVGVSYSNYVQVLPGEDVPFK